ncbi:MAG TPA: alpha/beta fold hydrolase, partial [Thermoanaerobaculia bacterium]|nr:alpha/beta fold hydrolase [Thermoanaerobaculia bacterium]
MSRKNRQVVRYLHTDDDVRLAWAEAGSGPPLVKAANWLTHLEYDWESPVWKHWMTFFSDHFRFIRFDERGCGMSGGENADLSPARWADDLESVIDAAAVKEPMTLLGISQGAASCVMYAIRHPERVARLILYGAYARGLMHRNNPDAKIEYRAVTDLARVGWGKDNPAFRSVFTSRFIPEGSEEQLRWFNELCRKTTSGPTAARLLEARAQVDVSNLLDQVRAPTLVIHGRRDGVVPVDEGRRLASNIAGAEFVELESRNHVLLEDEPAWARFCEEVLRFAGVESTAGDEPFATLSPRQREILALLMEGLGNAAIADRIGISEKTVRNQLSSLFDKLGVWTRSQAIV